ncbi:50S ribosomal protein L24 [Candidatus Uhrbacteria bacterium RIFCSPLOWO2_01_FULL_47_24]|uniref:Large ribosomal subunit protein uL24 n=1 Tax=Candidatus Uhrbacteria bacterium RIFCSPLOWO2_01_FULL_47_24 TaxID=1802401 RepID=A0A1F7UV89_9BACT|nr:MAG: 50S ribosomal protein L24 [Candidatus Uhrbacteria bacterium RIFCSPHIGHO2_01_FULL_47_11]OGL68969.1 MAG: 50S ribosomal protein L24 [Candidatus Uhrbacteria bacterium RIFCSPHIGHO2_02_FULL_46_47]OGL74914.1 MAG: 50S ribosomal protein L24 [Candidatus Uhrbacteria bacterium RIFCSPHIGHO2_12_FULL_47_11]OGL81654.1 MAG: 50S ribosomal protein L24 [Candidatus Uhrbacteria bacterium RIFCSPLOWO2_01_FULL_47_24]OGL85093.1 MAG: 50S ribosomal protein L24 [Candidatus Uhrbacteria bacterium RIFCSPLOWO2_02_FULL_
MKLHKGDIVKVISGAASGKTGKILKMLSAEARLVVEGVNLRKKHVRPKKQGQKGQTIEFPAPMQISNVALVCPKCGKETRVGFQMIVGEKKKRLCRKCKQIID